MTGSTLAHVPAEDARRMPGRNAGATFHLGPAALLAVADEIGTLLETPPREPDREWFPHRDVHKPSLSAW